MNYLDYYSKISKESEIAKLTGTYHIPLDFHDVKNYDKIYDKDKGYYKYETMDGASVTSSNVDSPEQVKDVKLDKLHTLQQDSETVDKLMNMDPDELERQAQEINTKAGVVVLPKFK
nr:MAG TPA: hypothetical protein [Caudoviricetes sp.]